MIHLLATTAHAHHHLSWWHQVRRTFLHLTGSDNAAGPEYGFWSGAGSDLGELAILGTIVAFYRHHKCASCLRIAHHPVDGTHYNTCHKHATADDHAGLQQRHREKYPDQHHFLAHKAAAAAAADPGPAETAP